MLRLRLNSAAWGNSIAWMVDHDGIAIGVDNHMQSGESGEDLLDEWGVVTAYAYGQESNQYEYCWAAKVIAYWIITSPYQSEWEEMPTKDKWDWNKAITDTVDVDNVRKFQTILEVPSFTETAGDAYGRLLDLGLDPEEGRNADALQKALSLLTTLFQRLMMRVRAGGLTNSLERGAKELYFRIPDTNPESWYKGIANFIWEHSEYAGFECYIYSDIAGDKKLIKEYKDCKEFLELHSSKKVTESQRKKLNSCYRQSAYYYGLFQDKVARYQKRQEQKRKMSA